MSVHYTEDFKKEVVKAYMAGDKSIPQIAVEFNVAKSSVSKWVTDTRKNASIDLYDRSAVASLNSDYINTDLAISTLKTALEKENYENGV